MYALNPWKRRGVCQLKSIGQVSLLFHYTQSQMCETLISALEAVQAAESIEAL